MKMNVMKAKMAKRDCDSDTESESESVVMKPAPKKGEVDWRIKMTVKEMMALLKEKGKSGYSGKKKTELIAMIEKYGLKETKKEEPKKEEKKEEEDLSIEGWLRKLIEIYLDETGDDRTLDDINDAGDYPEVLQQAIEDNGGESKVARALVDNLIKKGRTKISLVEEMMELREEGYTMFDDIIGSSKKNMLKKLREDIKKASQEAQKVWDANKNDKNPKTGQLSANAKQLIGKAEEKIRNARISSGGGAVEMIDDDEYNKIRNKYYTKG